MIISAVAALGGLYYYYTRSQPVDLREKAKQDDEAMRRKAREARNDVKGVGEAGKARAEDAMRQGQEKYDDVKVGKGF